MESYEQYLRDSALPRKVIDVFLDDSQPTWAKFDPELGYILGNSMQHSGMDNCWTISSTQKNGFRTAHMYADKPCRINSYGNSFTECNQVSDGESWQEYLAAHLGEPIRNYGVGGYGFYQAYRRMVRTERSDNGARYILLYIWGDDHFRSIMRCRHAVIYPWFNARDGRPFHANFWANIEMDIETMRFVEKESFLHSPESLYKMTDPDFMFHTLKDDLMVQLYTVGQVDPATLDLARLNALAEILGVTGIEPDSADTLKASADRIRNAYGLAATKHILEAAGDFCHTNGKELMILLLCPSVTKQLLHGKERYDQSIVDFLSSKGFKYFDMNQVHLQDYRSFSLSVEDYMKRYYIGHYSPVGNHFFAYSIKDSIVQWLNPKPITYRDDGSRIVDFEGYLPD